MSYYLLRITYESSIIFRHLDRGAEVYKSFRIQFSNISKYANNRAEMINPISIPSGLDFWIIQESQVIALIVCHALIVPAVEEERPSAGVDGEKHVDAGKKANRGRGGW